MTDEERKARAREYSRRYYLKAKNDPERIAKIKEKNKRAFKKYSQTEKYKAKCKRYSAKWYQKLKSDPELMAERRRKHAENSRKKYRRIKADPDRYAAYLEMKARIRNRSKDKINAKKAEWRKTHKKRIKRQNRWYADRQKVMFVQSPELYAIYRAQRRKYNKIYYDRHHIRKRAYKPLPSRRIPDTCTWNHVLDTRSVFLWNNRVAASLIAGREFAKMLWLERHSDRYGEVQVS